MPVAEGSTIINAPVEVVYNYLSSAENLPRMLRANLITEVSNIEAKPGGGYRYVWVYKILGKSIRAYSETIELVPCQTFAVKSTGGMDTVSRWWLAPVPEGTRATFSIEYAMDRSVLSWLTGQFAANQVRYSVEVALMALKTLVHQEVGFDAARQGMSAAPPMQPAGQAAPILSLPVQAQALNTEGKPAETRRRTVF
jgi:uncharacterized membrane protein